MHLNQSDSRQIVSSPYAWGVLALLTLIYITSFADRQIIAVLGTRIQADLQLSNMQVGLLYGTAFSIIYAVCGLFMGRAADLYSRKKMIIGGLLVWSLMTFISGFATGLAFLISARMLLGIAEAALSPAAYSLLADYFKPAQRATVFSIYAAGIFLGVGFSFLAGGTLAAIYDWRTALKAVGLPGIALAGIAWFVIKEVPRGQAAPRKNNAPPRTAWEVLAYMLRKKTILLHLVGFSCLSLTGYTILAFVGTVLKEVHSAQYLISSYGWFMFATGAGLIASGWLADQLARHWGGSYRFAMGMVAGLACLPLYYLGLFADSGMAALVFIGLANIISSSYNGIAAAILQYLVKPDMRALAEGLYLFVISVVGFGIGPPLAGWLMDAVFTGAYGPAKTLMLLFSCCGVVGSICFFFAMRTYEQDTEVVEV